jgi:hypothetical protein
MSSPTEEIEAAASALTQAMVRLVRAMDAVEDDGEAARHMPEELSEALEGLAARVSAAKGFTTA